MTNLSSIGIGTHHSLGDAKSCMSVSAIRSSVILGDVSVSPIKEINILV